MSAWVCEWSGIEDNKRYVVCAINRGDRGWYLSNPELRDGWQVKRLREQCYAAIPCPEFNGPQEEPKR